MQEQSGDAEGDDQVGPCATQPKHQTGGDNDCRVADGVVAPDVHEDLDALPRRGHALDDAPEGDVGAVVRLLERNAPYTPLGGWYRPGVDLDTPTSAMWFQNDWVHADLRVEGSELFLFHERVTQAARDFYDAEVIAFCADVGQGEELGGLDEKARATGASKCIIADLKEEFARDFCFPMLRANAIYEGEYLLGTSIARPVIAKAMMEVAQQEGADAISLGAPGKGNDQVLHGAMTWMRGSMAIAVSSKRT